MNRSTEDKLRALSFDQRLQVLEIVREKISKINAWTPKGQFLRGRKKIAEGILWMESWRRFDGKVKFLSALIFSVPTYPFIFSFLLFVGRPIFLEMFAVSLRWAQTAVAGFSEIVQDNPSVQDVPGVVMVVWAAAMSWAVILWLSRLGGLFWGIFRLTKDPGMFFENIEDILETIDETEIPVTGPDTHAVGGGG